MEEITQNLIKNLSNLGGALSPLTTKTQSGEQRKRRSKHEKEGRDNHCGCGKSYLSPGALHNHIKQKHGGMVPLNTVRAKKESKVVKIDESGKKISSRSKVVKSKMRKRKPFYVRREVLESRIKLEKRFRDFFGGYLHERMYLNQDGGGKEGKPREVVNGGMGAEGERLVGLQENFKKEETATPGKKQLGKRRMPLFRPLNQGNYYISSLSRETPSKSQENVETNSLETPQITDEIVKKPTTMETTMSIQAHGKRRILLESIKKLDEFFKGKYGKFYFTDLEDILSRMSKMPLSFNLTISLFCIYLTKFIKPEFFNQIFIFFEAFLDEVESIALKKQYKGGFSDYCDKNTAEFLPNFLINFLQNYYKRFKASESKLESGCQEIEDGVLLKSVGVFEGEDHFSKIVNFVELFCSWIKIHQFTAAKFEVKIR